MTQRTADVSDRSGPDPYAYRAESPLLQCGGRKLPDRFRPRVPVPLRAHCGHPASPVGIPEADVRAQSAVTDSGRLPERGAPRRVERRLALKAHGDLSGSVEDRNLAGHSAERDDPRLGNAAVPVV